MMCQSLLANYSNSNRKTQEMDQRRGKEGCQNLTQIQQTFSGVIYETRQITVVDGSSLQGCMASQKFGSLILKATVVTQQKISFRICMLDSQALLSWNSANSYKHRSVKGKKSSSCLKAIFGVRIWEKWQSDPCLTSKRSKGIENQTRISLFLPACMLECVLVIVLHNNPRCQRLKAAFHLRRKHKYKNLVHW